MRHKLPHIVALVALASAALSPVAFSQTLKTSDPESGQTVAAPAPQPDKVINCGNQHAIQYGLSSGSRDTTLSGACTSVVSSTPSPCQNAVANWGPGNNCAATGNASHGSSVTLSSTSPQFAGTAGMQCINGVFYPNGAPSPTCTQIFLDCPSRPYTWTVGGLTCGSGQVSAFAHGTQRTALNNLVNHSGSATYRCNNGTAELLSSSCVRTDNPCPAQTFTWTVAGSTCTASTLSATPNNATVTSSVPAGQPTQGSITHRCVNGSYQQIAPAPSCSPTPSNPGVCRAYSGSHSNQPATNSGAGCSFGTYQDLSDTSAQWRWSCQGSSGTAATPCSAQRSASPTPTPTPTPPPSVSGVCRNYTGTHANQPATSTGAGCSSGSYQDQADTSAQWRWSCQGSVGTPAASCSAQRSAAPTPTPTPTPPPPSGASCDIVEQHQTNYTGGSPTITVFNCPDRMNRNHVINFAPAATKNYGAGIFGGEFFRRRTVQHMQNIHAVPTGSGYRERGSATMRCQNGTVVMVSVASCGIDR